MIIISLATFYLITPLLILYLCHRFPAVNKLGAMIIAYAAVLVLGNGGIRPTMGTFLNEYLLINKDAGNQETDALHTSGLLSWISYCRSAKQILTE